MKLVYKELYLAERKVTWKVFGRFKKKVFFDVHTIFHNTLWVPIREFHSPVVDLLHIEDGFVLFKKEDDAIRKSLQV